MSDVNPTTDTVPVPSAPVAAAPETFSLDYVQALRQEAAKYRTERNEAVEKAKSDVIRDYESKLSEKDTKVSEIQGELSQRALELIKLKAVLSAEIPSSDVFEVAALIQGEDEESVSESVQRVKSLLGKNPPRDRPIDSSQGSGNHVPLNGDPILESLKRIVGA